MRLLTFILASACAVGSADATVLTATYTGSVFDSYDETGVFGYAATSLDGSHFRLTFTYDTLKGVRETGSNRDVLKGGFLYDFLSPIPHSSPMLSVVMTINGHDFSLASNAIGSVLVQREGADSGYPGLAFYWHEAIGNRDAHRTGTSVSMDIFYPQGAPTDLEFAQVIEPMAQYRNFFQIYDGAPYLPGSNIANGYLHADKLVISAVPLPASLGLSLTGCLLLAGLGYRRAVWRKHLVVEPLSNS